LLIRLDCACSAGEKDQLNFLGGLGVLRGGSNVFQEGQSMTNRKERSERRGKKVNSMFSAGSAFSAVEAAFFSRVDQ
jgi:hypothetical protein